MTTSVTLPRSCCTTNQGSVGNLNTLCKYMNINICIQGWIQSFLSDCYYNPNGNSDAIHTVGCGKQLSKPAVGQTIGLSVINSFLFIISFASVPVLLLFSVHDSEPDAPSYQYPQAYNKQNQYQPDSDYNAYNMSTDHQAGAYNSWNPTYGYSPYDSMNAYSSYYPTYTYSNYYPAYTYNNYYPGYDYSHYSSAYGYNY